MYGSEVVYLLLVSGIREYVSNETHSTFKNSNG